MTFEAILQARRVIEEHSRSFALAARFLPRHQRDDAVVLYAWCRRADDLVDRAAGSLARERLALLRRELDAVYSDALLGDPLLEEFRRVVRECDIPVDYPRELLAGLEMDVDQLRCSTMDELFLYCYRVAGTVGLMMCHVIGVRHEDATRNAVHLGIAMQLTNICRDVLEDWQRGRLYVPDSVLALFGAGGLSPDRTTAPPPEAHAALRRAVRLLLADADTFYRSGDRGMISLSWRCSFSIRTARAVYAAIGDRLAEMDYDPLRGRAVVSRRTKLRLVTRSFAQWMAEVPPRLREHWLDAPRPALAPRRTLVFPHDVLPLGARNG